MAGTFDTPIRRLGTSSIKWDRCKKKFSTDKELIPLWIADTDFRAPEEVMAAIHERTDHGVFGYTFAMEDYLSAVSGWFRRRHGLETELSWIAPTYGVVTALRFTIEALTQPGDKVMILTPAYEPFFAIVQNTGRTLVECPLQRSGESWYMDFDRIEDGFRGGVKMMIFCSPHNPVSRIWTAEELGQLTALCARYGVYLASDEIHCDVELFGNRFVSLGSFENVRDLVMCYTAPGKSFSMSGLMASNLIIPDERLRTAVTGKLGDAWIMSPNIFGLVAAQAAYEHGDAWLDEELRYLEGNSLLVQEALKNTLPEVRVSRHEGTFLMWLDFSALGLGEQELCRRIVDVCGLGLGFGSHYGAQFGEFMRINIGCARPLLAQAMERLTRVRSAE